jgi:alkylresorcinol/alkylpyrone synthase
MAVHSAFPAHRYPQGELARAVAALADAAGGLRPGQRALIERLHANADVATRYTVLPIDEYAALA